MSHALLEPITLRGTTFRNRVWIPPMCQYVVEAEDGVPTPWHLMHIGSFARGGAGAVIVEATGVVPEGRISPRDLGLWNDTQRDAFAPIVSFAQSLGAKVGIQIAHAGRKASTHPEWGADGTGSLTEAEGGWQTVAPSALAFEGLDPPVALDEAGIADLVRAFADSARRAVEAGFDFVEIHGAHGYLVHEFLSPLSNERTDAYGGDLAGRSRFLFEIVDAVRAEIGQDMPLLVRLSATDWNDAGLTVPETAELARRVGERGVDLVDVSTGGNVLADIPVGPGYQVPAAAEVRAKSGVPVSAVGMIDEPKQAEQIVATGQADVAMIGREALRDPNFALRAARELRVDIDYVPRPYHRAYK